MDTAHLLTMSSLMQHDWTIQTCVTLFNSFRLKITRTRTPPPFFSKKNQKECRVTSFFFLLYIDCIPNQNCPFTVYWIHTHTRRYSTVVKSVCVSYCRRETVSEVFFFFRFLKMNFNGKIMKLEKRGEDVSIEIGPHTPDFLLRLFLPVSFFYR